MGEKHPNAKYIKALANGEIVQYRTQERTRQSRIGNWQAEQYTMSDWKNVKKFSTLTAKNPDIEFRIKPKIVKWQPQKGCFRATHGGPVAINFRTQADIDFGLTYNRRIHADKAVKALRSHGRLMAYVAEFDPEWEADWNDITQEKYFVSYDHSAGEWQWWENDEQEQDPTGVHMSKECAKNLVDKLNSGEVEL